jgi:hypothetical protein
MNELLTALMYCDATEEDGKITERAFNPGRLVGGVITAAAAYLVKQMIDKNKVRA